MTYSGVPAGSVTDVRLSDDPSVALVTVRLDPEIPILRGVKASISRSLVGGQSTISLDGALRGAPPITRLNGQALPEIPAKKAGLLGSSGNPMALVEKVSSSVDKVSRNLDARGQERARAGLAALAADSANWSRDVARISDSLTGTRGKLARLGNAVADAGDGAARMTNRIDREQGAALRPIRNKIQNADRALGSFGGDLSAARPTIRSVEGRLQDVTEGVRSVRRSTQKIGDQAEQMSREGLTLFGRPKLPDYEPANRAGKPSDDTLPRQ